MEQVLEYFVGSIFLGSYFVYIGSKFFDSKLKKTIKLYVVSLVLMIFITANYMLLDNILKSATLYLAVLIIYRVLFSKNILQCAIGAFLSYMLLALGEVLFIITVSILEFTGIIKEVATLTGAIISNFSIASLAFLVGLLVYKHANKLIKRIKEHNKITLIITFSLLLAAICSFFYKMYFHDVQLDKYLLFNVVLVLTLTYIAYVIIKQYYDKVKLGEEYEKYVQYSKQTEKLVNQYSISQHENKNELIIIKSMVNKNNKKLLGYLDEIISSKDNIDEAWIRYLQYLPFGGLKGIIHNKICDMKENNINVFLNISKDIAKSKLKDLSIKENVQLLKIVGVFLDNANEASSLSNDKEISICIFQEEEYIVFEISNTYVNDVDLTKIGTECVTSKGKGRGYGLTLVKSIINENKNFLNDTQIIDKYFVQVLKIKTKK